MSLRASTHAYMYINQRLTVNFMKPSSVKMCYNFDVTMTLSAGCIERKVYVVRLC